MYGDKVYRITLEYTKSRSLDNVTSIFYEIKSIGGILTISTRKKRIEKIVTVERLKPYPYKNKLIIWCYEEEYAKAINLLDQALLKQYERKFILAKRELEDLQNRINKGEIKCL